MSEAYFLYVVLIHIHEKLYYFQADTPRNPARASFSILSKLDLKNHFLMIRYARRYIRLLQSNIIIRMQ